MSVLKVSRCLEKQKREIAGENGRGILLTFTEDRALTAIQALFAAQNFQGAATCLLTPEAQQRWGYKGPIPIITFTKKDFKRTYMQKPVEGGAPPFTSAEGKQAMSALQGLAQKEFVLEYSSSLVTTRLLDVQQLEPKTGHAQHLRVALSPIVFHGVISGASHHYVTKPRCLHHLLDAYLPSSGTRSPQLLRLAAWVCCLQHLGSKPTEVYTGSLAWIVGSSEAGKETLPNLPKSLEHHFKLLQKIGLVEKFSIPTNPNQKKAKWKVKRADLQPKNSKD